MLKKMLEKIIGQIISSVIIPTMITNFAQFLVRLEILIVIFRCYDNLGAVSYLYLKHGKEYEGAENPYLEPLLEALERSFEVTSTHSHQGNYLASMKKNFQEYSKLPEYPSLSRLSYLFTDQGKLVVLDVPFEQPSAIRA
jgi:hypothetical protein